MNFKEEKAILYKGKYKYLNSNGCTQYHIQRRQKFAMLFGCLASGHKPDETELLAQPCFCQLNVACARFSLHWFHTRNAQQL